jgi:hypothetical protein
LLLSLLLRWVLLLLQRLLAGGESLEVGGGLV